jgi:predicted nucleic acid-binding protein
MDAQKMEFDRQKAEMEEQYNRWKTELDAATKVTVARIGANPGVDIPLLEAANAASERMTAELGNNVVAAVQQVANLHEDMANKTNATMDNIASMIQTLNAPKRIIRGPDGKAIGVEIAV